MLPQTLWASIETPPPPCRTSLWKNSQKQCFLPKKHLGQKSLRTKFCFSILFFYKLGGYSLPSHPPFCALDKLGFSISSNSPLRKCSILQEVYSCRLDCGRRCPARDNCGYSTTRFPQSTTLFFACTLWIWYQPWLDFGSCVSPTSALPISNFISDAFSTATKDCGALWRGETVSKWPMRRMSQHHLYTIFTDGYLKRLLRASLSYT